MTSAIVPTQPLATPAPTRSGEGDRFSLFSAKSVKSSTQGRIIDRTAIPTLAQPSDQISQFPLQVREILMGYVPELGRLYPPGELKQGQRIALLKRVLDDPNNCLEGFDRWIEECPIEDVNDFFTYALLYESKLSSFFDKAAEKGYEATILDRLVDCCKFRAFSFERLERLLLRMPRDMRITFLNALIASGAIFQISKNARDLDLGSVLIEAACSSCVAIVETLTLCRYAIDQLTLGIAFYGSAYFLQYMSDPDDYNALFKISTILSKQPGISSGDRAAGFEFLRREERRRGFIQ